MMGATVMRASGRNSCIVNSRPVHFEQFGALSPAVLFALHSASSQRRHSAGFFQRTRPGIALQHSVSFISLASSHSRSFMMNCGLGSPISASITVSHGEQLTRVGAFWDPRSFSQLGKLDWREAHGAVKIRSRRKKGPRITYCRSQAGGDQPSSSSVLPPLPPIAKAKGSRINFCSRCGGTTEEKIPSGEHEVRFVCSVCGAVHYQNPKMVVGCLVEHEDQVLLCRRNIEPSYGLWTLPGGYMEIGESAAEGAARETREEACADVQVLGLFALLDAPLVGESYIIFRARLKDPHFTPGPESLECALFKLNDIPFDSLAFSPILVTLKWYLEDIKAGQLRVHHAVIDKRPGSSPSDPNGFTVRDILRS